MQPSTSACDAKVASLSRTVRKEGDIERGGGVVTALSTVLSTVLVSVTVTDDLVSVYASILWNDRRIPPEHDTNALSCHLISFSGTSPLPATCAIVLCLVRQSRHSLVSHKL